MNKTLREILKDKNIPQSVVAEALGIQTPNLKRYDNLLERSINEVLLISQATGIHISELINSDEFLRKPAKVPNDKNMIREKDESTDYIYLLPVSAHGGSLSEFVASIDDKNCEKIISPIRDADFAITVLGDSMAPEYPNGSQILIKRINEKAFIDWGKAYVLDTCNGVVIKRIFPPEEKNSSRLKCVSINPEYPPFEVSTRDVYGMYRVMLCMAPK